MRGSHWGQAAKGLQLGPADPNNVSQRVPGLQGLHAREARDVSTQIWVETSRDQRPCLGRRAQCCCAGLR